jgi:hypothetical protein
MPAPYPLQLELHADRQITRWRPLVQWLLAIPHLMIAYALRFVRQALTSPCCSPSRYRGRCSTPSS